MTSHSSTGPPVHLEAISGDSVSMNNKIIFLSVAALVGLVMFMCCTHIYAKCFWGDHPLMPEDEVEEADGAAEESSRQVREGNRRRYRLRRHSHHRDEVEDTTHDLNQREHMGLHKSAVGLVPTFVFKPEVAFRDDMECAVCLQEFVEGEVGRLLPKCSHCFHVQCIDMWFLSHSSCPLCRCQVAPSGPDPSPPPPRFVRELQQQQLPFLGPSASMMTRFRDVGILEECPAVSSLWGAIDVVHENASDDENDDFGRGPSYTSEDAAAVPMNAVRAASTRTTGGDNTAEEFERGQPYQQQSARLPGMHGTSRGIPCPGSQCNDSNTSPRPVVFLEYRPELNLYTSTGPGGLPCLPREEIMAPSPRGRHERRASYLAVEIIGEF